MRPPQVSGASTTTVLTDNSCSAVTDYLLEQYGTEWAWNLKGSPTVHPTLLPASVTIRAVYAQQIMLLGKTYEVRVVSIEAGYGPPLDLARMRMSATPRALSSRSTT
jgi:hypothetical protein